ncbi:MAG: hypothetical protein U1D97_01675 [Desulfuromonadales bacterium]|nr:hypothetical protein [Desulfuromonadales bacterium]
MLQSLLQEFFEVEEFEEINVALKGDKEVDVATSALLSAYIRAEEAEAINSEADRQFGRVCRMISRISCLLMESLP